MTARPLSEAVQQAEEAISGGNYQLAVETCRRVLGQFPEFATAHRLLAEAQLEAGDVAAAEQAFQETLQRDPQSSAAYAGLATIAEGKGDVESALAYAQVAWEISPQRADLRDRVATLSERHFGKGGRLHLTRPALASLHFRAGRWSRAAAEAASVLVEHPGRVDVQLRMAESLWRRGSLTAATNACRSVLESAPSAVMALLMLADVERRAGHADEAAQLLERARAVDPDGVRAADLVTIGSNDLAEFMLPTQMPEFDDSLEVAAEVERPRIAPAPDFNWTQPPAEEKAESDSLVAEAPKGTETSAAADEGTFDVSLPDDAEIEAARPPARTQHGYTSMLESLEGEGLMPFRLEGDETDEVTDTAEAAEFESATEAGTEPDAEDTVFGLVSDEEIDAARPSDVRPRGYTTLLNSLDETGVAPFEIEGAPGYPTDEVETSELSADLATQPEAELAVEPQDEASLAMGSIESVDYGSDLTAGWDDIDAEIQRATPSDEGALDGYTGELRGLDEIGLQPFSIEGVDDPSGYTAEVQDAAEFDENYGADLSFLDTAPPTEPVSPSSVDAMSLDVDLTDGWATIDEEIQNAIPSETPPGYTDQLNELNVSGVEPFFVEADEPPLEAEAEAEVDNGQILSEDDVVSDELAAGIDLWSFDNRLVEPVVEEMVVPVETDALADGDLFAFADGEDHEVSPVDIVEMAEPEPWEPVANGDEAVPSFVEAEFAPMHAELVEPVADDVTVTEFPAGDTVRSAIAHLGVDASLFERARQAKAQLVQSGEIQGDQLLPGVEPPKPALEVLEAAVQEDPENLGARREYVAALLDAQQFERAFSEFQWMHHSHVSFEEQDLNHLAAVADEAGPHQVHSHRLLGAIYRRAGNHGKSARHYQMSLAQYRDDAGKEA